MNGSLLAIIPTIREREITMVEQLHHFLHYQFGHRKPVGFKGNASRVGGCFSATADTIQTCGDALMDTLDAWVMKHYRTELRASDLDDPALINESLTALDALTNILKLGPIYPFQQS